jgi:hypothetical protein
MSFHQFNICFLGISALFTALFISGATQAQYGPTTSSTKDDTEFKQGEWKDKKASNVHVQLDDGRRVVHVSVQKDEKSRPKSLLITFFDKQGHSFPMELKAENPLNHAGYLPGGPEGHFAGDLREAGQSYVGFELKIPFGHEKAEVLKYDDFEKSK